MIFTVEMQWTTNPKHPDAKGYEAFKDLDRVRLNPKEFTGTDAMVEKILNDTLLMMGGGYDTDGIEGYNIVIEWQPDDVEYIREHGYFDSRRFTKKDKGIAFLDAICEVYRMANPNIANMYYEDNRDTILVRYVNGHERRVNIRLSSREGILKDLVKQL